MTYRAPVNDMLFMMRHVGGLDRALREGSYPDLSLDVIHDILGEAGRFAGEALAPINRTGDRHGAELRDGAITTAPGFKEAYQAWVAGWLTRSPVRSNTAARTCRSSSKLAALRCGTGPAWHSASLLC